MAFFMTVDEAPQNAKFKALREPILLTGDITGLAAIGLWNQAGAGSQASRSDGLVSLSDLLGWVPDRAIAVQLADLLVAAGLWHAPGHSCPQGCPPVPEYHYRFHDWFQVGYTPGADVRVKQTKSKELKQPEITNAVWWRDCEDPSLPLRIRTAKCRYCQKRMKHGDRRSDLAPTFDHVDPHKAAGARNIVLACAACNRSKGARTPQEAGMTLHPAPRTLADITPATAEGTPAPAAAVPSPAAVAGMPAGAYVAAQTIEPAAATQSATQPTTQSESSPKGLLAGAHGGVPARTAGSGSGSGSGLGSGEGSRAGSGEGDARPARRRSRRRRGRGGRPSPAPTTDQLDAGDAPLIFDPPTGGSPWADWSGPPSPISDQNVCSVHDLHQPCRKCAAAVTEETR